MDPQLISPVLPSLVAYVFRQYLIAILLTTHIHKTQEGGNTPVSALAEVQAGELVTFDWGDWSSVHDGYALFFLLRRSMR